MEDNRKMFLSYYDRIRFNVWLAMNDMTKLQFSRKAGISPATLTQVLKGNKPVSKHIYDAFIKGGYLLNEDNTLL